MMITITLAVILRNVIGEGVFSISIISVSVKFIVIEKRIGFCNIAVVIYWTKIFNIVYTSYCCMNTPFGSFGNYCYSRSLWSCWGLFFE